MIDSSADAPGTLFESTCSVLWRFRTDPRRPAWSIRNVRRKPAFIVSDSNDRELLSIRRTARLPPTFEMIQAGGVVGLIRVCSAFRNSYSIALRNGSTWRFRMPLYRIVFRGRSNTGSEVWVSVGDGGKKHWNILLGGDDDPLQVLTAIAFIHREWWCYA